MIYGLTTFKGIPEESVAHLLGTDLRYRKAEKEK